ncbi:DUF3347 domain-containing protein [Flavobacterium gawalongense]|uniref:DUF3347 domain-containing protein n=2 Tax=Flavobacterium TaxID=237 RepID=A0A553BEG0_9FLAO|nr:DUF3347 domain-containing protein [Flavobacterium gawalongense]TRW98965.1 DUF3347 domain-containing protein [Flavobacterium gawalongense]TRX03533.1 DUF3347 domain-containing protein [Flavobacterium gawalongense]TRX06636.1 DUF3347 domain-containing protein [Flavobacterium gawalongense]TRX08536.1 DUF3347 domain-containing protein [Flavobacterium gawalongense]TRX24864.1 DUF3347 domain-containing protein [Flavobacterium gawalongense]
MKYIILSALAITLMMVSCNQKNEQVKTTNSETTENSSQLYACPMHPEITGKKGDKCPKCGMELTEPVVQSTKSTSNTPTDVTAESTAAPVTHTQFSIDEIINNYLKVKNALTKDDTQNAGNAGKVLYATFNAINPSAIEAKLKKEYLDIADDAKEHAEHIGDNAGKIDHQREHFAMLSEDINDLIKVFGTKQKLYQDFCPMYNEGKGAIWISETKEIKNPYYGSKMLTCGSMKKQL